MKKRSCTKCKVRYTTAGFHNAGNGKLRSHCRRCYNDYRRRARRMIPKAILTAQHRAQSLKLYGLTVHDYNRMLRKQGYRCAICRRLPKDVKGRGSMAVDHDHKTGLVRGILCYNCNSALGYLGDRSKNTNRATQYLVRYGK